MKYIVYVLFVASFFSFCMVAFTEAHSTDTLREVDSSDDEFALFQGSLNKLAATVSAQPRREQFAAEKTGGTHPGGD